MSTTTQTAEQIAAVRAAIAEAKALCSKVTPGPWSTSALQVEAWQAEVDADSPRGFSGRMVCMIVDTDDRYMKPREMGISSPHFKQGCYNADFIAASRTLLPAQIALAEALLDDVDEILHGTRMITTAEIRMAQRVLHLLHGAWCEQQRSEERE